MDTARQTLRWGIPGAIALAWATICYVAIRSGGDMTVSQATLPVRENVNAAVAIFGSIPVGWICYQVYYFSYRPLVLWRWGPWVRRDRGAEILEQLTQEQMVQVARLFPGDGVAVSLRRPYVDPPAGRSKLSTLLKVNLAASERLGLPTRVQRNDYRRRWHANWDVVRGLMTLVADDDGQELKAEATTLGDVYHSIGAARFAMYGGLIAGAGYSVAHMLRSGQQLGDVLPMAFLLLVFTVTFGSVLHRVRRHTWRRWVATLGRGLRLHFAVNPTLLGDAADRVSAGGYQDRPLPGSADEY
jgi:hypothetical protein